MTEAQLKRALQQVTDENNLKALRYVADILITNWQKSSVVGANEWETVKNAIMREERKKALDILLEEIERIAHE